MSPARPKLVGVTVDGRPLRLARGLPLLEALDRASEGDLGIPHYCWHPHLGSEQSCRSCRVEVSGESELQPACALRVREGLEVWTGSPAVQADREAVLELMLLDHPLDCPICDQSGDCALQRDVARFGPLRARGREPRRPREKRLPIGPRVVLDRERCVLCTRCVRFCEQVTGGRELAVLGRGSDAVVDLLPGRSLEDGYSMNVAELCPVGALTTRHDRFRSRAWQIRESPGLCAGCARGCNAWLGVVRGELRRLRPRRNDAVNRSWMCDEGRLSYRRPHAAHRQRQVLLRGPDGTRQGAGLEEAIAHAALRLQALVEEQGPGVVAAVLSAHASNEDAHAVRALLEALGSDCRVVAVPEDEPDALLRMAELAPNAAGARALGFGEPARLLERMRGGGVDALLVFGRVPFELLAPLGEETLQRVGTVVCLESHQSEWLRFAHVSLPGLDFHEKEGSYVSGEGRLQSSPAVLRPGWPALREGELAMALAAAMELPAPPALGSWQWQPERIARSLAAVDARFAALPEPGSAGVALGTAEGPEEGEA